LGNQISIQRSVLDGFGEVGGQNIHLAFEIRNGSGHLLKLFARNGAQS